MMELVATRQGSSKVLCLSEIYARKNLTIMEVCHFPRFYILIWPSFQKIETENLNLHPCFFSLVKMGMISLAAHFLDYVHIGRSHTIAAIIWGF